MKKIRIIVALVALSISIVSAQRGGSRGGMNQQQMDPKSVPKIGVIYGTVVDSASKTPIPYASISVINQRSNTIMTGGISNEDGEFRVKEIPLGRHKVVVEYIGYAKQELGPFTFLPSKIY